VKVRAGVGRRARQVTPRVVLTLIAAIAVAVIATVGGVPGLVNTESGLRLMVGVLLLAATGVLGRLHRRLTGDADRPIPYHIDRTA